MFYVQHIDDHGAIVRVPFDGSEEYGFVCAECGKYEVISFEDYFSMITCEIEAAPQSISITCPECFKKQKRRKNSKLKIIAGGLS